MNASDPSKAITGGKTALGVEFGSTRIKAVLIRLDLPSRRRVDGLAGHVETEVMDPEIARSFPI